jgi:RNA polymerase sigma-70 factor, ECF subfamily
MGVHEASGVPDLLPSDADARTANGVGLGGLIGRAHGGSTLALGQLLEHCRRYLLTVANESLDSDLRPKGGASDLVQDTFVEAQRDFPRFRGTTEKELLAWLTTILSNRVSNHVRHYRHTWKREANREVPLGNGQDDGSLRLWSDDVPPLEAAIARDEEQQLLSAMERLPSHLREVLILRTWERRSFAEIAARLEGTPESVRKLWGRAVRLLRDELSE